MARTATPLLPRAERRRSILAGAATAFATGGFDGTSMEAIAEAAGVTKLIVYRHFESKEELYRAILEEVSGRLANEVTSARGPGHGGRRRQGVFPAAFLAVARQDPAGFRLLWRHSSREPKFEQYAGAVREASVGYARVLLEDRVDPALLDWAAPTAVAFLVESVLEWLDHGEPAADTAFLGAMTRALPALISAWGRP